MLKIIETNTRRDVGELNILLSILVMLFVYDYSKVLLLLFGLCNLLSVICDFVKV